MWFRRKSRKDQAQFISTTDAIDIFAQWALFANDDLEHLTSAEPQGDSVLEKALWTVCTARLEAVVGFASSRLEERIDPDITPLIQEHATELKRQYQRQHKKDRYGVVVDSGWLSEKEYFIEQIIAPKITQIIEETKVFYKDLSSDADTANMLFDAFDDNYLTNNLPGYTRHVPLDIIQKLRNSGAIYRTNMLFLGWLFSQNHYRNEDNITALFDRVSHQQALQKINDVIERIVTMKEPVEDNTDNGVDIFNMSPYEYEEYCAEILSKNGWTARATKKSGDQGADVYAERDGISIVIQCKLTNTPVGNKAVQEIISGQKYMSADYAAVVSPAPYTPGARDLAKTARVLLLDHDDLKDLAHIITLTL